jgi:hypothetical protein
MATNLKFSFKYHLDWDLEAKLHRMSDNPTHSGEATRYRTKFVCWKHSLAAI